MEPEAAGNHLDIIIGAELTALKRTLEELTILQYHKRSMRIIVTYQHVGKHVVCEMDETRNIGSEDDLGGPFAKNSASP
eukprot:14380149-Ditylum_brightwellii.AAC.1